MLSPMLAATPPDYADDADAFDSILMMSFHDLRRPPLRHRFLRY